MPLLFHTLIPSILHHLPSSTSTKIRIVGFLVIHKKKFFFKAHSVPLLWIFNIICFDDNSKILIQPWLIQSLLLFFIISVLWTTRLVSFWSKCFNWNIFINLKFLPSSIFYTTQTSAHFRCWYRSCLRMTIHFGRGNFHWYQYNGQQFKLLNIHKNWIDISTLCMNSCPVIFQKSFLQTKPLEALSINLPIHAQVSNPSSLMLAKPS